MNFIEWLEYEYCYSNLEDLKMDMINLGYNEKESKHICNICVQEFLEYCTICELEEKKYF